MENVITKNTAELERLEGIIEKNIGAFYEVGHSLMEIRDKRLYIIDVLKFKTFEKYCKAKWDYSRSYAYRLIDSANVVDVVSPIGNIKPTNESQVRPLTKLEPQQQLIAWQKAVDRTKRDNSTKKFCRCWSLADSDQRKDIAAWVNEEQKDFPSDAKSCADLLSASLNAFPLTIQRKKRLWQRWKNGSNSIGMGVVENDWVHHSSGGRDYWVGICRRRGGLLLGCDQI